MVRRQGNHSSDHKMSANVETCVKQSFGAFFAFNERWKFGGMPDVANDCYELLAELVGLESPL